MAELLIKAVDNAHPDPVVDRQGKYKRGMIVNVYPDGGIDGRKMTLPNFFIVRVPGMPVDELVDLVDPQTDDDEGVEQGVPMADGIEPVVFRRRKYKLDVDRLPSGIRQALERDGHITLAEVQITGRLKRIRDGKPFVKKSKRTAP